VSGRFLRFEERADRINKAGSILKPWNMPCARNDDDPGIRIPPDEPSCGAAIDVILAEDDEDLYRGEPRKVARVRSEGCLSGGEDRSTMDTS